MKEVKIHMCFTAHKPDKRMESESYLASLLNIGWKIESSSGGNLHIYVILVRDK